ncbi:MAG: hypothetical protein IJO64_05375 [Clostridia bacterium]|nr:hypothetical protein [Clostridia bacterium]
MFKKILSFLLAILTACLCGCSFERYETSGIRLRKSFSQEDRKDITVELSQDDIDYFMALWNGADWEEDVSNTIRDYYFDLDGVSIGYSSESGLFNDGKYNRHLFVSEEERNYINSLIKSAIEAN